MCSVVKVKLESIFIVCAVHINVLLNHKTIYLTIIYKLLTKTLGLALSTVTEKLSRCYFHSGDMQKY